MYFFVHNGFCAFSFFLSIQEKYNNNCVNRTVDYYIYSIFRITYLFVYCKILPMTGIDSIRIPGAFAGLAGSEAKIIPGTGDSDLSHFTQWIRILLPSGSGSFR